LRVFVAGAYGFIGRHVVGALVRDGWRVTGGGRDVARGRKRFPDIDWAAVDFNRDRDPAVWRDRLTGFAAVVNCVGVLQSALGNASRRVHVDSTVALFRGAAEAGVRRLVHISALGADDGGMTAFARDKAAADASLAALDIDWIVLRPSLVCGDENSGGTALIETLARLPGVVPVPQGDMTFQPIHADDLARIVARCLDLGVPARRIYDVGGPETLTLREIISEMRRRRGLPPAYFVAVPDALVRPLLLLGDLAGWLGVAGPLRSTALIQGRRMPLANSAAIVAATGIAPRPMRAALKGSWR
jgi:uncharacterized protein YbjT (DUF2867 family)